MCYVSGWRHVVCTSLTSYTSWCLELHMQATLAAYDIAAHFPSLTVSCYTFGAPRTGNRAFADDYSRMVEDTWHIINGESTVCMRGGLPGSASTDRGSKAAACCSCRSGPRHPGWQTCRLQAAWPQGAAAARGHAGGHLMTRPNPTQSFATSVSECVDCMSQYWPAFTVTLSGTADSLAAAKCMQVRPSDVEVSLHHVPFRSSARDHLISSYKQACMLNAGCLSLGPRVRPR